jgi:peptidoglycan/LPS O-acetylase OafA/YrhL
MIATHSKTDRIPALDYTKGALVLIMVLYHWLNYFVGTQGFYYRYLRFLTPSFIFITGFLISNVYLSKYRVDDPRLPKRLMRRGLKILAVFLLLNVGRSLLLSGFHSAKMSFEYLSPSNMVPIYVLGNNLFAATGKIVAFYILVPISYLLVLSAFLLIACRLYKYTFYAVCVCFLLSAFVLGLYGVHSSNLELLAIGLLGVISGYLPIGKVNGFLRHPYMLAFAYLCYAIAISIWNVIYPLQILGVCLSLMVIYLLGSGNSEPGRIRRHIILLGKYSLFGYIAQIAILQLLYRGLGHGNLRASILGMSFLMALALTLLSVEVVDRARAKVTAVDRFYKVVFS